jgi:hypothetical protein
MPVHVLTVVEDLMFRPNVTSQLKAAGIGEARLRADVPVGSQVPAGTEAVGLVDLGARTGEPLKAAQAMLAAGLPVVGYCGHTEAALRAAAKAAGVTVIASNGEIHGGLPILIGKALAHRPDPDCNHC